MVKARKNTSSSHTSGRSPLSAGALSERDLRRVCGGFSLSWPPVYQPPEPGVVGTGN